MNELKTLIDICPGTRLPHYEAEIFSDKELAGYYLHKLCEQYEWYYHGDSAPGMAYRYAKNVMKSRWPEAECIIASDPCWAYLYAKFVMNSRWPEAEAIISSDRLFCELYNNWFGASI